MALNYNKLFREENKKAVAVALPFNPKQEKEEEVDPSLAGLARLRIVNDHNRKLERAKQELKNQREVSKAFIPKHVRKFEDLKKWGAKVSDAKIHQ